MFFLFYLIVTKLHKLATSSFSAQVTIPQCYTIDLILKYIATACYTTAAYGM